MAIQLYLPYVKACCIDLLYPSKQSSWCVYSSKLSPVVCISYSKLSSYPLLRRAYPSKLSSYPLLWCVYPSILSSYPLLWCAYPSILPFVACISCLLWPVNYPSRLCLCRLKHHILTLASVNGLHAYVVWWKPAGTAET